jgi:hypothetical protein
VSRSGNLAESDAGNPDFARDCVLIGDGAAVRNLRSQDPLRRVRKPAGANSSLGRSPTPGLSEREPTTLHRPDAKWLAILLAIGEAIGGDTNYINRLASCDAGLYNRGARSNGTVARLKAEMAG